MKQTFFTCLFLLCSLAFIGSNPGLKAQTPLGPITVSNQGTADSGGFSSDGDIAINSSNDYAQVWNRRVGSGTNNQTVFLRLFNADGTAATNDIQVSGVLNKNINSAQVGMDDAGNAYVLYDEKLSSSGTLYSLKLKRFSPTGTLLNQTNVGTIEQSCYADLAVMNNGRVVVLFTDDNDNLRLRLYSNNLLLQGQLTVSSGTRYYQHHIDERDGDIAIGYQRTNDFNLRKYRVTSTGFLLLAGPVTMSRGFCNDPIALRKDGKVALLTCYGSSNPAEYELRNSNLTLSSSTPLPNPDLSSNFCAIDTDVDDNTYVVWRTNDAVNGRSYNSSNTLTGTFNTDLFPRPSIATYDCRFVVGSIRNGAPGQIEAIHRRFTCEDCNFNTNFSYTLECLGERVLITVTADQNYPNSLYNLYQVSTPSTADPLGNPLTTVGGNSATFMVPNTPGNYYVIKHGNWSSECPWQERRILITLPTFNAPINEGFSYGVIGSSGSSVFNLDLDPDFNSGTTSHVWFLSRGPSQNGPWTWVDYRSSADNNSVLMTNHARGFYYLITHVVGGPCYAGESSSLVIFVNEKGLVSEIKGDTKKTGVIPPMGEMAPNRPFALNLWPNPANDRLSLSWDASWNLGTTEVEIYNAQGQFIRRIEVPKGQTQLDLSTSDLGSGLYFLSIHQGEVVLEKKKFTIQR